MNNGQLEMSFEILQSCQSRDARRRRHNRAQWWFARMRQVVDRAVDWRPVPVARPEQIWFTGTYRQVAVAAEAFSGVGEPARQVCE